MIYLVSSLAKTIRERVLAGEFALLVTPYSNYKLDDLPGIVWAADNGCFSAKWKPDRWWNWLTRNAKHAPSCLFATSPDVVGDHLATMTRTMPWVPRIRALGYAVAFVLQDGCTDHTMVPWNDIDWVFVGGTDAYKESENVRLLLAHAQSIGVRCHMGRVNSLRRMPPSWV